MVAHFSLLKGKWEMNNLLLHMCRREKYESLAEAAEAARTHTLLLMPISEETHKPVIKHVERFFRLYAEPKYNELSYRSRPRRLKLDEPWDQALSHVIEPYGYLDKRPR